MCQINGENETALLPIKMNVFPLLNVVNTNARVHKTLEINSYW